MQGASNRLKCVQRADRINYSGAMRTGLNLKFPIQVVNALPHFNQT
jgi:hypothetical protein